MKQVLITVNGPGEISAWLTPLSRAIKARNPDIRIVAMLLPCVYSSGAERRVLEGLDSVDATASVRDSLKLIAFKTMPEGIDQTAETLVVRLGGDMVLSSWLARRIGAPAFAYTERPNPVLKRFQRIFDTGVMAMPTHIGNVPVEHIGEMMVDASAARRGGLDAPTADQNTVGLFPGSRNYMAEFSLPYWVPAIDAIAAERPGFKFMFARSDYSTDAWLKGFPPPPEARDWQAGAVTYQEDEAGPWFKTPAGTRIDIRPNAEVFRTMKAALSVPGTNTGEMAAAGIPTVTILPTYRYVAENVPLRGIGGLVTGVPVIGPRLKVMAAKAALKSQTYYSQANRRADRLVVPDLVGENLHDDIKTELIRLMEDDGAISADLQSVMGAPGAANRFADAVVGHFA